MWPIRGKPMTERAAKTSYLHDSLPPLNCFLVGEGLERIIREINQRRINTTNNTPLDHVQATARFSLLSQWDLSQR